MAECEPAVDHMETLKIRPSGNFEVKRFRYVCPAMWVVETEEDYGPKVENVRAFKEEDRYCLFRECKECTLHTSPKNAATYKDAHFYKLKYCTHTRFEMPKYGEDVMKKRAFIIRPIPHGNGGICGIEVEKEFKTVRQALKSKPYWDPDYSPYDCNRILNKPRLCLTKDFDDCLYIFEWDKDEWREIIR